MESDLNREGQFLAGDFAAEAPSRFWLAEAGWSAAWAVVRPLHALIAAPSLLFLATNPVMLFRPPDLQFYWLDRITFLLLAFAVFLRAALLRQRLPIVAGVTWPTLALFVLALSSVIAQPFEPQTWSLFATKFVVPFTLFHLSILIFEDARAQRQFETFAFVVLAYLSFTAVAFLAGAKGLIVPRFILDESLGIHADRARGPFLQAVANGVTLNILGLMALHSFGRRRIRGLWGAVLLICLPLSILATMTRAVWLGFAGSTLALGFRTSSRKLRRACLGLTLAGSVAVGIALLTADLRSAVQDRAGERGPVEIRLSVYKAGWEMFLERPLSGWGVNQMPSELGKRMSDFHVNEFWVHNTYLEILVEHGVVGLGLYAWIIASLFRLVNGSRAAISSDRSFLDEEFRLMWPIVLGVYLFNAVFVVMNYQFVNALLFTLAGMLAGRRRRRLEAIGDVSAG
jgi:O-antigen ligase